LLRAAALFSPARLVFTIAPYSCRFNYGTNSIQLPCFQHATSIKLDTQQFILKPPAAGEFPSLETLSISGTIVRIHDLVTRCPSLRVLTAKLRGRNSRIEITVSIEINMPGIRSLTWPLHRELLALETLSISGCNIDILGEFISSCPSLRVLRVEGAMSGRRIMVHSTLLRELVLVTYKDCRGINIVTPQLKQLTMEVHAGGELTTSVVAPLVQKVSWRRKYTRPASVFGFWILHSLSLETAASIGKRVLTEDGKDDAWLSVQQLPHAHVLSMDMSASVSPLSCSN
jgi:hypothetical protein